MSVTVITTKTLGTTTQVVIKRYGSGMVSFQETTAGKGEQRIHPGESKPEWVADLVEALDTVA